MLIDSWEKAFKIIFEQLNDFWAIEFVYDIDQFHSIITSGTVSLFVYLNCMLTLSGTWQSATSGKLPIQKSF